MLYFRCILLLCLAHQWNPVKAQYGTQSSEFRREISGLLQKMQRIVEKLQRHELRAKQVGDETLQSLTRLEGTQTIHSKNIADISSYIASVSSKLANIENSMVQRDLREREHTEKLLKAINTISNKLDNVLTEEKGKQLIKQSKRQTKKTNELQEVANSKLEGLNGKLDEVREKVQSGLIELTKQVVEGEKTNFDSLTNLSKKLDDILNSKEALIKSVRLEVDKLNNREESQLDSETLRELSNSLQEQTEGLKKILQSQKSCNPGADSNDFNSKLKTIIYQTELFNNETQDKLEELKTAQGNEVQSVSNMNKQLVRAYDEIGNVQGQIKKRLADASVFSEVMWEEVSGTLGELVNKLSGVEKLEEVVIESADLTLDTKRRLEYGIQQILLEVEDVIKTGNEDVKKKGSSLAEKILTNQTTTVNNATDQLQSEISQVWRQINFMYTTLSDSKSVLETVENQTKAFVNDSLTRVQSMDGQVGQVLYRMADVEDNLNHLLGRLSLVVQEFNDMKYALGSQFDQIRTEFSSVYSKIAGNETKVEEEVVDDGPEQKGPIPIDERTLEELGLETTTPADDKSSEKET